MPSPGAGPQGKSGRFQDPLPEPFIAGPFFLSLVVKWEWKAHAFRPGIAAHHPPLAS